jgi:hypothetical protein
MSTYILNMLPLSGKSVFGAIHTYRDTCHVSVYPWVEHENSYTYIHLYMYIHVVVSMYLKI